MPKKRTFVNKKEANRFRLLPTHGAGKNSEQPTEQGFAPTTAQLDEQHECGIFFDDDYDYMQHLRSREDKAQLVRVDEEAAPTSVPGLREHSFPSAPPPPPGSFLFGGFDLVEPSKKSKKDAMIDADIERVLDGLEEADDMDDDFIKMLGGPVETSFVVPQSRNAYDSAEDEDEDEEEDYMPSSHTKYSMAFDEMDSENDEEDKTVQRDPNLQRDIDEGFDSFMEAAYGPEKIGGLDPEDPRMRGVLDPNNPRIIKLISKQKGVPEYDPEYAKDDVRKRLRAWATEEKEDAGEMEMVEVDEGASKRLKWDCESFASQYTNIYNHPAQIREPPGKLSKKALRRIDRLSKKEETIDDEDEEMMDDSESVISTVSTMRPKGETAEERRLRKNAVKESQRQRRVEKKQTKVAFAEEARRVKHEAIGNMKVKPLS